jgi:hypothetical protein
VKYAARSRIHERPVSLRFLGIILKVLRLEVSVYNVGIKTSFRPLLLKGWGESVSRSDCDKQEGKLLRLLSQLCPRIRPLESTRVQENLVLAEVGVSVPEFSRLNSGTETPTSDMRVRVQTVENK